MNFLRLAVPLTGQDDELRIGNSIGENIRAAAMRHITDDKMIVVAHENQGWDFDVFQAPARVVFLARQHMAEVKLYRAEIGYAHLEIFFDEVDVIARVDLRPTHDNRVLTHVFFVTHLNHLFGDPQWDPPVTRMCRAAGRKDEFTYFTRMIEGKKLRNPAAHGVAANDRTLQTKMLQNRRGIICEHLCAVFNR